MLGITQCHALHYATDNLKGVAFLRVSDRVLPLVELAARTVRCSLVGELQHESSWVIDIARWKKPWPGCLWCISASAQYAKKFQSTFPPGQNYSFMSTHFDKYVGSLLLKPSLIIMKLLSGSCDLKNQNKKTTTKKHLVYYASVMPAYYLLCPKLCWHITLIQISNANTCCVFSYSECNVTSHCIAQASCNQSTFLGVMNQYYSNLPFLHVAVGKGFAMWDNYLIVCWVLLFVLLMTLASVSLKQSFLSIGCHVPSSSQVDCWLPNHLGQLLHMPVGVQEWLVPSGCCEAETCKRDYFLHHVSIRMSVQSYKEVTNQPSLKFPNDLAVSAHFCSLECLAHYYSLTSLL